MCTLIILRRPRDPWPLLLAGNRDEMPDRPWAPPARHWQDRPDLVAGFDQLAQGSWMGINDYGVVSVVMNRANSLGPLPGRRSRGELVLEALDHAEAAASVQALLALNPNAYRPFNLFIGDPQQAYWLRNANGAIRAEAIPEGLHMLTSMELNDSADPRIRRYLPLFRASDVPNPDNGQWTGWRKLLACREHLADERSVAAMCFHQPQGLSTLSSSLIALPRYPGVEHSPIWHFCAGPPDRAKFVPVDLDRSKQPSLPLDG